MNKKTVRDIELTGKRVLVRVDFNVPLEDGAITDETRIRAAVPTLNYILEQSPKALVLMSHLGRPKGERNPAMSLAPVAPALADHLGKPVVFVEDCVGDVVANALAELPEGGILLLENTRYYKGETKNDAEFAAQLAANGDVFVNDAFGTAHRAHASNVGVSELLPAVAGMLLEKEIDYLSNTIASPERPFVAILGGAKVSDKIKVIESLIDKVDYLLVGGGMANTFNAAQGFDMAKSLVETSAIDVAKDLIAKAGDKLRLPVDGMATDDFSNDANTQVVTLADGVPADWESLDAGPETIANYNEILDSAKTVVWNGPVGVFEMEKFAVGTFSIAEKLAEITANNGAVTIIGGGDSAAATEKSGLADKMTHISTGGGASLEMLEGKDLPGLVALNDK